MMIPIGISGSLQIVSTSIVYLMVVLSACSAKECELQMTEKIRARSVIFRNIDMKLCQTKCFEDIFIFASCPRSSDESKRTHETSRSSVHPENHPNISSGACSQVNCKPNTRCVERHRGVADCDGNTSSSSLERRCSTNSDCPAARKFKCFTNTCKCIPGYSFNPASNSCVRRCKTYGDGFTTYQRLGIRGNNNRTATTITAKECAQLCITEKTFMCLTYEYRLKDRMCHLSTLGYLDVWLSDRLRKQWNWIFATRNCL